jgi:hypothetical protein
VTLISYQKKTHDDEMILQMREWRAMNNLRRPFRMTFHESNLIFQKRVMADVPLSKHEQTTIQLPKWATAHLTARALTVAYVYVFNLPDLSGEQRRGSYNKDDILQASTF